MTLLGDLLPRRARGRAPLSQVREAQRGDPGRWRRGWGPGVGPGGDVGVPAPPLPRQPPLETAFHWDPRHRPSGLGARSDPSPSPGAGGCTPDPRCALPVILSVRRTPAPCPGRPASRLAWLGLPPADGRGLKNFWTGRARTSGLMQRGSAAGAQRSGVPDLAAAENSLCSSQAGCVGRVLAALPRGTCPWAPLSG